jgi:hypothetical protein
MSVKLLSPTNTTTTNLRQQTVFTRARLTADPRGEPFRGRFDALREDWRKLSAREFDLQDEQTTASAELLYADFEADAFVDEVDKATEQDTGLRKLLFGNKQPAAFKRPIAGVQLASMETWIQTLANSKLPTSKELTEKCFFVVDKAKAAVRRRNEAARALKEFNTTGARKQYTDKLNAARVEVFNHFDSLVVTNPSLGLTRQYARGFFLQGENDGTLTSEEELTLLQEELEGLRQDTELKEERVKELLLLKEARDQEDAREQERQAKIADLERELSALKAQPPRKRRS